MFKVNNKDTKTMPVASFIPHLCFSVFIVNFEQVNADCEGTSLVEHVELSHVDLCL